MRSIVVGLLAAVAFTLPALAAPPPQTSATPTPSPSPSPSRTPAAIVPPRDAPAVRSTTPPLVPAYAAATPTPPQFAWVGTSASITLPMEVHDERPFIQALIDGHPATLIVDTGTLDTVIDGDALDDGGESRASLQIDELRFPKVSFARYDVRTYAERYFGAPADGIIGRDLLARFPVRFDYPGRTITIFRDSRGAVAAQVPGSISVPLRVITGLPAIAASLDGQQPKWLVLATGASSQLQVSAALGRASGLGSHSIPYQEPNIAGVSDGVLVRARTVNFGSITFHQPLVALFERSGYSQPDLVGSVGAMLLSRLSLIIDEPSSQALIYTPGGSTLARLYDPSGITLENRHGTIVLRSVVPGTPADGHLRPGDEVVSLIGLAPATLDFARQLLDGNPGAKVTIAYRRWHIVHTFTWTLRVIV